jgi:hypothetical protein
MQKMKDEMDGFWDERGRWNVEALAEIPRWWENVEALAEIPPWREKIGNNNIKLRIGTLIFADASSAD